MYIAQRHRASAPRCSTRSRIAAVLRSVIRERVDQRPSLTLPGPSHFVRCRYREGYGAKRSGARLWSTHTSCSRFTTGPHPYVHSSLAPVSAKARAAVPYPLSHLVRDTEQREQRKEAREIIRESNRGAAARAGERKILKEILNIAKCIYNTTK